jgi:hypothetical protein
MPLVDQELLTLPEHLSAPPVFSGVCVTRSLALCVCLVDRCLSFCPFSLGHCVVWSSSIYGFGLPLWYLQTLLNILVFNEIIFWGCWMQNKICYNWIMNQYCLFFPKLIFYFYYQEYRISVCVILCQQYYKGRSPFNCRLYDLSSFL